MTRTLPYTLLAFAVLVLVVGPIGSAAYVLGFGLGESPCVLCWAQRTAMALVALCGLFVLRYGPRPRYLGLSVLIASAGMYMGLRHSALHLARDVGQGFSAEILGAHTYTWSLFIFWVCVAVMGALLMMLRDGEATAARPEPGLLGRLAMPLFLVAVAGNIVQAFASTGPPPYLGQSDPIRFSFNPRHWVWSLEEWAPAPISLRGRWAIGKPGLDGLDPSPAAGPLQALPTVTLARQLSLPVTIPRPITDLTYDAASERFLATTPHGLYIVDDGVGAGAAAHRDRSGVLRRSRDVQRRRVPRPTDGHGAGREQELRRAARERPGRRREELPLLPRVLRRVRRAGARPLHDGAGADDVRDVGGLRSLDLVRAHGDGAERAHASPRGLALRPAGHDAVGGVRARASRRAAAER